MKPRPLALTLLVLALAIALCVGLVDRPLALWLHGQPGLAYLGHEVTGALEQLFGFNISVLLYCYLALAAALILSAQDRSLRRAGALYAISASAFLSRFCIGALKGVFERVRPYDYVAAPEQHGADFFVSGANSFPSGHAAIYFGLLLPVALLFPRWRWPMLGLAALGALARVLEGDHYLGDVLASALAALLIAAALIGLLERLAPLPNGEKTA